MKFSFPVLIIIFLLSCTRKNSDHAITTVSLLNEMIDLRRLAVLPKENYRTIQFSSYDRRSTKAADSCWFSNDDGFGNEPVPGFAKVLKKPDADGIGEYLICDVRQPGAIVRLWTAGLNGKIRLYLDDPEKPVFEGAAQDFFWKTAEMLSGKDPKSDYSGIFRQFDATYFPIPFSKGCRMEWIGDLAKIHFYHVGIRIYEPDADVETYKIARFRDYIKKIGEVTNILKNNATGDSLNGQKVDIPEADLPDSAKTEIYNYRGSREIEYFALRISAPDMERALRQSVLTIFFDDSSIPQVEAPVGDFFGSAPGLNPYLSMPFTVGADGMMICRFVMPFKKSVRIQLENWSGENIKVQGLIGLSDLKWEEGRTMHFRARWKIDHRMTASSFDAGSNGVQDIIYLMASGKGRLVGTGAFIYNPSNATTSWGNWWGEGDEKIFVDSDTFPSFFGTGSEDYFNYSWSSARIFSFPYCGQSRNDGPGNRGYVSDYRWHIPDDIPFSNKIAFYMELGHHGTVPDFSYGRIVYFYALPEVLDDYRKISVSDIRYLPYLKWEPIAYLGSADFRYIQAEKLISESPSVKSEGGNLWADGTIMMWRPSKKGEKIKFNLNSDVNAEEATVGLTLSHNPDGGIISVAINGKLMKFDGNETMNLYEPIQSILANHFSEPVGLKKGKNEVIIESTGSEINKHIGIDFVWLKVK
jgi:hypothetical protein